MARKRKPNSPPEKGAAPAEKAESPFRIDHLLPFRFRRLNGHYLLTNDGGNYLFLEPKDFERAVGGPLPAEDELYKKLDTACFINNEENLSKVVGRFRGKHDFLGAGPVLHIVVPTLRCNQKCIYCHASAVGMSETAYDMDMETAKKTVDTILQAPARHLTLEFQGGEPLTNWEAVKFITEYAREKARMEGKSLQILLVTNLTLMDDAKLEFLIRNEVGICTSLDGHQVLHNKNRGGAYSKVRAMLEKVTAEYKEKCSKHLPAAIVTVTRYSLPHAKEIVDEYLSLGFEGMFVRPVNPLGFAREVKEEIGYSMEEYARFYQELLGRIMEVNRQGTCFYEQTAAMFITKILCDYDPNFVDMRSPCGAGIGQIAYGHNGNVYTCDEGRMLSMMGDESFKMGSVRENTFEELLDTSVVKTMCVASCLDGIPACSECVYKPYCGTCPVFNYVEYGDLFLKGVDNAKCKLSTSILDGLFNRLQDPGQAAILKSWVR